MVVQLLQWKWFCGHAVKF